MQAGEGDLQSLIGLHHSAYDGADGLLQEVDIAILAGDDLFPVPLIHVDGMEVVHFLVTADGVHIGEQTLAHVEFIALQRQTFPLGQRMHHLTVGGHIGDIEGNRAFHAVQVIIQTGVLADKQGSGNAAQIQRLPQIDLKVTLDELDGALHLVDRQRRFVTGGNEYLTHALAPLSIKICILL